MESEVKWQYPFSSLLRYPNLQKFEHSSSNNILKCHVPQGLQKTEKGVNTALK